MPEILVSVFDGDNNKVKITGPPTATLRELLKLASTRVKVNPSEINEQTIMISIPSSFLDRSLDEIGLRDRGQVRISGVISDLKIIDDDD
jgi:hypothetical protein